MTNKRGGYLSLDTEYSIPSFEFKIPLTGKNKGRWKVTRKPEGLHGWKNPKCDVYTFIYAAKPDDVKVIHSKKGFNRKVPYRLGKALQQSHTIIGANLKADLGFIWHELAFQEWLLKGGEIWDVQYVSYLLSGQRWLYPSLADMQKHYLGSKTKVDRISYLFSKSIDCKEIISARDRCKRIWESYNYYAKEDGRTPMLIMQKQYAEAKAKGMLPLIKVYNRYLLALIMMEVNGITLDMPAVERLYQEYSLKMVEYLEQATEMVKEFWTDSRLPAYNVNSSQHNSALLFGGNIKSTEVQETGEVYKGGARKGQKKTKKVEIEVPVKGFELNPVAFSKETKKKGVYEVNEGTIENIYKHSKNQAAHKYCKLLKLSKAYKQKISTYLNAMLNMSVTGVVRPNYNNCATATSRLSCSAPNAQNLPAHGEFGDAIQSLLVSPAGWTCVNIDYSQLETFCRALLTRDPTLISDLENGKDFHIQNMCWGYGISYEEGHNLAKVVKDPVWAERRSGAKAVTFGEAYGQMPESMAARTGWETSIIEQIYKQMYENYPELITFEKKVNEEVEKSSVVATKEGLSKKSAKDHQDAKGVPTRFFHNVELLPIRERDKKTYTFDLHEYRHIGTYVSITGKRYTFKEYGSRKKDGEIFRYYKPTQQKNYGMQGLAGDCQAITTAEMFMFLLENQDKVKLVNEVHDSKWFLIKNEHLACILPKLCGIMKETSQLLYREFNIPVIVNFEVEAKTGKNFSEMTVYKGED